MLAQALLGAACLLAAYESFKYLKGVAGPDNDAEGRRAALLKFWVLLSFVQLVGPVADATLGWFPFYGLVKLFGHVCLLLPYEAGGLRSYLTESLFWPLVAPLHAVVLRRYSRARAAACACIVSVATRLVSLTVRIAGQYASESSIDAAVGVTSDTLDALKREKARRLRVSANSLFESDGGDQKQMACSSTPSGAGDEKCAGALRMVDENVPVPTPAPRRLSASGAKKKGKDARKGTHGRGRTRKARLSAPLPASRTRKKAATTDNRVGAGSSRDGGKGSRSGVSAPARRVTRSSAKKRGGRR